MTKKIPDELKIAYDTMTGTEADLIDFVEAHQEIIELYEAKRRQVDEATAEVKKLYAKHYDTVGKHFFGFKAAVGREVDTDKFMQIMDAHGEDPTPYMKYSVTLKRLDEGLASGKLPKEVQDAVVEGSLRISSPRR